MQRTNHAMRFGRGQKVFAGVVTASIGIAALAAAVIPANSAHAAGEERGVITVAFSDLVPGNAQVQSTSFELERSAEVASLAWVSQSGVLADADLDVELCPATGACVDQARAPGVTLPKGTVTVLVTAMISDTSSPGQTGFAVGSVRFVSPDQSGGDDTGEGALAFTGTDVFAALGAAGALVVAGLAVLIRRRKRPISVAAQVHTR